MTSVARTLFSRVASVGLGAHHERVRLPRVGRVAGALAELARLDRSPERPSILDVGAGDGRVGRAIADVLDGEVRGVDVKPQESAIPVSSFDGRSLPFAAGAFDFVVLADVLHHAEQPGALLAEAVRVAGVAVLVKDHFAFGPWSRRMLRVLDEVGNAQQRVAVRARYFSPAEWLDSIDRAGACVTAQIWPLRVHPPPICWVTRDEIQFAARVEVER
jgi:SAM-dependent methyltransferase